MIEINTIGEWGFEGAIRGMRNPYESHEKSDSRWCNKCEECGLIDEETNTCYRALPDDLCPKEFVVGNDDMALCKKLIRLGSEHRKFLRMIHVQADVKAPRYWWAEMDKYKYVEANSSSTMHLITKRELTIDDFSVDTSGLAFIKTIIGVINSAIKRYNEAEDKSHEEWEFRCIKQILPESYNQLRTIDTNYECLLSIYHQRRNHRLTEWREFCEWIKSIPYMEEFLEAME